MEKKLEGLRSAPAWATHIACLKGCSDYLNLGNSMAWVYGGTGHAFVINMHEVVCPSGPTAWRNCMLHELAPNLGMQIGGHFAIRQDNPDFAKDQEKAWGHVRECIDKGVPCYGWELEVPEYYTIHGYDDTGYYFSGCGCDDERGPKPWNEIGMTDIMVMEMYSAKPCEKASDEKVVKDALAGAIRHARNPEDIKFPKYEMGLQAYELWAKALEEGRALHFGQGYNAAVWAECRKNAVEFLKEAKSRLPGKADELFDEAIGHYTKVYENLKKLYEMYPFVMPNEIDMSTTLTDPSAAALVREAGKAEEEGLGVLELLAALLL